MGWAGAPSAPPPVTPDLAPRAIGFVRASFFRACSTGNGSRRRPSRRSNAAAWGRDLLTFPSIPRIPWCILPPSILATPLRRPRRDGLTIRACSATPPSPIRAVRVIRG